MTRDELREVLRLHDLWLRGKPEGKRANLSGCDLFGAHPSCTNLTGCDLSNCDLSRADLMGANQVENAMYTIDTGHVRQTPGHLSEPHGCYWISESDRGHHIGTEAFHTSEEAEAALGTLRTRRIDQRLSELERLIHDIRKMLADGSAA